MQYRQAMSLKDASDLDVGLNSALDSPQPLSKSAAQTLSSQLYRPGDNFFRHGQRRAPLYSAEERRRRDDSRWTLVQGVLAPVQFAVFAVSLVLVLRYLATGEGFAIATASVVVKTLALYAIMITGSIWEKVVFGRYLFARAFFWEDVFSMLVLALHTAYLAALATGTLTAREQMLLALAAYATYVINATQFILKLRAARLDRRDDQDTSEMLGQVL
jgi:3-vinyl bacteriochlorophyllide hydratase